MGVWFRPSWAGALLGRAKLAVAVRKGGSRAGLVGWHGGRKGQRAGGEGNGQQAETEEGRGGKGIPFYFFEPIFQIRFQRVFESFWHLGQNQTSQ